MTIGKFRLSSNSKTQLQMSKPRKKILNTRFERCLWVGGGAGYV